ncbi:MAG: response regulator [Arcobacteraceae bacterium]
MIKKKILIVDDVASNIHMLSSMLKEEYSIVAAKDGLKAIEIASKEQKPDLILLDIVMPEMDGYEVCKKLKESDATKNIPIIFVSSLNDINEEEKAILCGGNDYISKPVSKDVLKNKVQIQLQLNSYRKKTHKICQGDIDMKTNLPKLLIIDDAPSNIQIAVEILKDNYIVSVATSGEKALAMIEDGLNPDLILLDIIMPEMDGFEVCKRLKNNPNYCQIPIIFLTILENQQDMINGLELGAVDYVTKPFEAKVLKARVDAHVKLKRYQDELVNNIQEKENILMDQSKLATLGEMFENITHQWKQPLSIISMVSSTIKLEQETGTLNDESLLKLIGNLDNSVEYLANTVNDFRDFLIRDNPKEYFKVKKVVQDTLNLLGSKLSYENIEVEINLTNHEILNYKNDFIQVLMNVFSNAIQVLKKSHIDKKISIKETYTNETYSLFISDNGGGIDDDIIEKVFNKYFTTKDNNTSSGLGLYMCKKIIEENMDGTFEVKSKKDEAIFEIKLPNIIK